MQPDGVLRFTKATIAGYDGTPAEDGWKGVLVIKAPFGRDHADILRCLWLYTDGGTPHPFSEHKVSDDLEVVLVELPGIEENSVITVKPDKVTKLTIKPIEDLGLEIQFRVHLTGQDEETAHITAKRLNKSNFHLVIRPQQAGLFDEAHPENENLRGEALEEWRKEQRLLSAMDAAITKIAPLLL